MTAASNLADAARAVLDAEADSPERWAAVLCDLRTALAAFDAARGEEPKPVAWVRVTERGIVSFHPTFDDANGTWTEMAGAFTLRPLVYGDTHPTPPPGEVERARVDRAARALWERCTPDDEDCGPEDPDWWESHPGDWQEGYRDLARAALLAAESSAKGGARG